MAVEPVVRVAFPLFALLVLAGMLAWKVWPKASPLWTAILGSVAALWVLSLDRGYIESGEPAAVASAAFAAFSYLEWRAIHRPAPAAWPRRRVKLVGAGMLVVVAVLAVAAVVADRIERRSATAQVWGETDAVVDGGLDLRPVLSH